MMGEGDRKEPAGATPSVGAARRTVGGICPGPVREFPPKRGHRHLGLKSSRENVKTSRALRWGAARPMQRLKNPL
jgi:hypothetical protein